MAEYNDNLVVEDALWPFTLWEYERAAIAALQGGIITPKPSKGQKLLGGIVSGIGAGLQLSGGNPAGGVIGGIVGATTSFLDF